MRRCRFAICFTILALCGACGHSAHTRDARDALNAGNPERALKSLNKEMDVDSEQDVPDDLDGDNALFVLDRAVVLQQLGNYKLSARDLELADKRLEMFDFNRGTGDEIARFMFSDSSGPYKAPPYEKLMINSLNLVNYLVAGDANGAKVEARRLAILQKYLRDNEASGADLLGPGSYLAGFAFEKTKAYDTALAYYEEALAAEAHPSLCEPLAAIAARGIKLPERSQKLLQECNGKAADADSVVGDRTAELLVVVGYGRVPAKEAMRIPLGLALADAGNALSPAQASIANERLAKGAVVWVNFPTLPAPRPVRYSPLVRVDNAAQNLDVISVDSLVVKAWQRGKPAMVASAITRALSRAVAGEVTQKAVGGGLGLAVSLLGQAALTINDTPDTRSWATLPARIGVTRVRVAPGKHTVELGVAGGTRTVNVDLKAGEWRALSFTSLSQ